VIWAFDIIKEEITMSVSDDLIWPPLPHQPGVLLIHLLNHCNLRCQHCYLEASPSQNTQLPLKLVIRSLSEVEQLGIATVNLSGGEPFLYPELPEVLTFVSKQQSFGLHISTNGTLIGEKEIALLKNSGASVQVSIDGPEEFHDRFRGCKGAFHRASQGIQQLVAAEVPVTIVITLCQDNLVWLAWLAEWAARRAVERISVQPLLQLGRGSEIHEKKLSEEQLCDLFLQLSDLGHAYRFQGLRFGLAYRTRQFLLAHPCAAYVCNGPQCHRKVKKEIKKLVIREDGTVLPEIPTLNSAFAIGNLLDGTLSELVARYFTEGYAEFDRLCRTVYEDVIPTWSSPIIPWDEIVSERSWTFEL
jgi:MoaA/NifB/PqqE/SkfB family radical SAM enzyme